MPLITPLGVCVGVTLGSHLAAFTFLSPWLFAWMTFAGSLSSRFRELFKVMTHPVPMITILIILHLIMPMMAWGFGHVLYANQPYTISGLILAMAIPTGISSLIWVSMAKGHTTMTLAVIIIDTLLSPLIVPWTMAALVGERMHIDTSNMMWGLIFMIVIPSMLGMWLNDSTNGRVADLWAPRLAPFSKIMMGLVVMLNASFVAPYVSQYSIELLILAGCVLLLTSLGYMIGWFISILMKWSPETSIAVMLTSGMRNISAGSVIAITYFPPLVAVPIVCCILFQQSLAAFFSKWHRHTTAT